jgi:hypothetical protein
LSQSRRYLYRPGGNRSISAHYCAAQGQKEGHFGSVFIPRGETVQQLVDRFYRENEDMIALQQYEMAKGDFEYFMRLVDLAVAYHCDRTEGGKESVGSEM